MSKNRQKQVDRYLRAANIGTTAMIAYPLIYLSLPLMILDFRDDENLLWPIIWFLFAIAFLAAELFAVFYVFFCRKTDEFTLSMWHSGTTCAFFAAIVWLILGGYIETTFGTEVSCVQEQEKTDAMRAPDGSLDLDKIDEDDLWDIGPDIVSRFATPVILSAFYLGFQIKRFKGELS